MLLQTSLQNLSPSKRTYSDLNYTLQLLFSQQESASITSNLSNTFRRRATLWWSPKETDLNLTLSGSKTWWKSFSLIPKIAPKLMDGWSTSSILVNSFMNPQSFSLIWTNPLILVYSWNAWLPRKWVSQSYSTGLTHEDRLVVRVTSTRACTSSHCSLVTILFSCQLSSSEMTTTLKNSILLAPTRSISAFNQANKKQKRKTIITWLSRPKT